MQRWPWRCRKRSNRAKNGAAVGSARRAARAATGSCSGHHAIQPRCMQYLRHLPQVGRDLSGDDARQPAGQRLRQRGIAHVLVQKRFHLRERGHGERGGVSVPGNRVEDARKPHGARFVEQLGVTGAAQIARHEVVDPAVDRGKVGLEAPARCAPSLAPRASRRAGGAAPCRAASRPRPRAARRDG